VCADRAALAITALLLAARLGAAPAAGSLTGEAMRFASNRWTQPERAGPALARWEPMPAGYRRAAISGTLELWVRPADLAIRVLDRRTGYAWASAVEGAATAGLNETWAAIARSALTIEYIDEKDRSVSESVASGPSAVTITDRPGGFDAEVAFATSGIALRLEVRLAGDSVSLRIPADGIREPSRRLVDVSVYPFLGAAREERVAGYVFLPDGCGALIRFGRAVFGGDSSFSEPVYGEDLAIDVERQWRGLTEAVQLVHLPVFGAAHGTGAAGASAYLAAIESGAEAARIEASPAGSTTPFTRVGARFVYRKQYFQPTSRSLGGLNVWQADRAGFDAEIRWFFLAGAEADYVGMARRYQRRLVERGLLARRSLGGGVPVLLTVPGADREPGFLRPRVVTATTFAQLADMVDDLVGRGLSNPIVLYEGHARGGLYGALPRRFPVEPAVGGEAGLEAAARRLAARGVPLHLLTDFTLAVEGAGGFSVRTDAARKANGQPLRPGAWYLAPRVSLARAAADGPRLAALGVTGLSFLDTSYRLFTDFSEGADRAATARSYRRLVEGLASAGLEYDAFQPNEYLLGAADRVAGAPSASSQYLYETDTVPFYQIVLAGYVDVFAPPLNLSADPVESLLRAIEWGSLPSFTLTADQPRKLAETAFEEVTTSWYPLWRDRVLDARAQAVRALAGVRGQGIASRTVPAAGVVRVGYDDGTAIVVNYTAREYADPAGRVPARGFAVFPARAAPAGGEARR
jgi:hypothetical protein